MSVSTNNINSADRGNLAVALIGGATAQSYDAVGMQALSLNVAPELTGIEYIALASNADTATPSLESSRQFHEKETHEPLVLNQAFGEFNPGFGADESISSLVMIENQTTFVPELLSRYEDFDQRIDGFFNSPAASVDPLSGETSTDSVLEVSGDMFSLADFLAEAIQQTQSSQAGFENSFDSGGQGQLVESVGLIHELLGSVGQPIGAFAVPSIGASLTHSYDESLYSFQ